jgi:limonene-1,2-epoxide hydrolase
MRGTDLIRQFVDAMNRHDIDAVAACYSPAARIIYPGREPRLPAEYANDERAMLESVPDYRIEPLSLLEAESGHVLLELRMSGTQRADLGGRAFSVTGAYVFWVEEGLIVEERAYPDMAGLRKQLTR